MKRVKGVEEISRVMVKTHAAVRQKMINLELKVLLKEQQQAVSGGKPCFCSSKLEVPAELSEC